MKYRKKPVVIEAVRCSDLMKAAAYDWSALPEWIRDAYEKGDVLFIADHMSILTLEGRHRANPDDMVIRGVKGEIYPCKPDIFAATYEPATEGEEGTCEQEIRRSRRGLRRSPRWWSERARATSGFGTRSPPSPRHPT